MENPATSWGVELGHESLRAVRLGRKSGRIEVEHVLEIGLNPPITTESPEERIEIYAHALGQFRELAKITESDSISVTMPGLESTSVPIKLPPQTQELDAFLEQQIYRNFLFPTGETVYRYQALPSDNFQEKRVFVVAYPQSELQVFLQAIRKSEIKIQSLQPAPAAIVNFLRFEFRDLEKTLLVNFRYDGTDIVLGTEAGVWFRSLPDGGNRFRKKLRYEFGVPREEVGKIASDLFRGVPRAPYTIACDEFLDSILVEVQKALDFQALHASFTMPSKIFITGECSRMPGTLTHFSDRFHCWVERLEKTQRVFASPELLQRIPGQNLHHVGSSIGAALKGVGAGPIPMSFSFELSPSKQSSILVPPAEPVRVETSAPTPQPDTPSPETAHVAPSAPSTPSNAKVLGVFSIVAFLLSTGFVGHHWNRYKERQNQIRSVESASVNAEARRDLALQYQSIQEQLKQRQAARQALQSLKTQAASWGTTGESILASLRNKQTEAMEASFESLTPNQLQVSLLLAVRGSLQTFQSDVEQALKLVEGIQSISIREEEAKSPTEKRIQVELTIGRSTQ